VCACLCVRVCVCVCVCVVWRSEVLSEGHMSMGRNSTVCVCVCVLKGGGEVVRGLL